MQLVTTITIFSPSNPRFWERIVGTVTLSDLRYGFSMNFDKFFLHPQFNLNVPDNNLAILRFTNPHSLLNSFSPRVNLPVCIPQIRKKLQANHIIVPFFI